MMRTATSEARNGSVLERPVLVLSRSYLPLGRVKVKDAICLIVRGKAQPAEFDGERWIVRSVRIVIEVPEQIVLVGSDIERRWRVPSVTRKGVLSRDNHTCQYCGATDRRALTLDHVLPRSRGGRDTWENLVAACERCNLAKGDRLPEECGMQLRSKPRAPIHPAIAMAEAIWASQRH